LIDENVAKNIVDSLYKNKKILPVVLVSFKGTRGDYGLVEIEIPQAKHYKKINEFVVGELYPFVKKKTIIRKFNSFAIVALGYASLSAFDIAWNNDEKIAKAGMFETDFNNPQYENNSLVLNSIDKLRKRPNLKLWLTAGSSNSSATQFKNSMDRKKDIEEGTVISTSNATQKRNNNFALFLVWAFPI
jgi:hypothetical protein